MLLEIRAGNTVNDSGADETLFEQICGGSAEERSRTLSPMESMSSSVDKAPKRTKGAKRTWNSLTNG